MRAVIYALMTTLWIASSPGLARNGETGILVMVKKFEFVKDSQHQVTALVLCNADLLMITEYVEEGYVTSIYLPGYGVFEVESTPEGGIRLYQQDITIQSRDCHPTAIDLC